LTTMGDTLLSDSRLDFIQDFTLKTLRLKPDKWARMTISDEQRNYINHFIERPYPQVSYRVITCKMLGLEKAMKNALTQPTAKT